MQRAQPPSNNLRQQYKRQASFGTSNHDNMIASNNNNNNSNNNNNNNSPYYYSNELQTVGMRIRQCIDQGYNLLNREKSDLSNASLNANDNVKNYASLIVPQYNPSCATTINSNDISNNNNNNSDYEDYNDGENEKIYSNGKRKYN